MNNPALKFAVTKEVEAAWRDAVETMDLSPTNFMPRDISEEDTEISDEELESIMECAAVCRKQKAPVAVVNDGFDQRKFYNR